MKNRMKPHWDNFISQFKKKDRPEVIQDIISNCVDNLIGNGNQLSATEIAFIALSTHQRIKAVLSERAEMLKQELEETINSVNTL